MTKIPVTCPTCGEVRMLRPSDAARAKQCRRCHLTEIAPLGYAATAARYGEKFAVAHLRTYRLENPSDLEVQMMAVLDELALTYEREVLVQMGDHCYLIDFVLDGWFAIEVNGSWAHQFHQDRDSRKFKALARAGYHVLVVDEHDLSNGIRRHILEFTGRI